MIRILACSTIGLATLAAAPGQTQHPIAAEQPARAKPADPDKKICRNEASTGSRMRTRTCRTKAEWDAILAADQGAVQRMGREIGTPIAGY